MSELKVSELFYSIQGEGPTTGKPAVFVRLSGCNLICGGAGGKFMEEGRATWWCDTEVVWRKGEFFPIWDIIETINHAVPHTPGGRTAEFHSNLSIVITGGEPTMPVHREGLIELLKELETWPYKYIELETNGTGETWLQSPYPPDDNREDDRPMYEFVDQINCSPKLSNSGMPKKIRYVPEVLGFLAQLRHCYFKFVVSNEADITEVMQEFVIPFHIPLHRLYLMPGVDSLVNLAERTRFVCERAKEIGCYACTRLHILAWDKTTGV